jgi:hypothetical protein
MARKNFVHNPFAKHDNVAVDIRPHDDYPLIVDPTKPQAYFERWNTEKAVQEGYKVSEWVYTCVTRISTAASSVPWRVYQDTKGGRTPYVSNRGKVHPIEDLLDSPNPYMNGGDFFELLTQHLYLGGNATNRRSCSHCSGVTGYGGR